MTPAEIARELKVPVESFQYAMNQTGIKLENGHVPAFTDNKDLMIRFCAVLASRPGNAATQLYRDLSLQWRPGMPCRPPRLRRKKR